MAVECKQMMICSLSYTSDYSMSHFDDIYTRRRLTNQQIHQLQSAVLVPSLHRLQASSKMSRDLLHRPEYHGGVVEK